MVALIIMAGCNNNKTSNDELVKLDNIKTPDELEIMTPSMNRKNQELAIKVSKTVDLINNSNNFSDQEMEELEEAMEKYAIEMNELQNQIIRITNPEVIEDLFDKIRGLRGVYGKYLK